MIPVGGVPGSGVGAEYPGLWRGTVDGVDDPEERGRYRVRIDGIHTDSLPVSALPWAETVGFNAHGACLFANYERGDRVVVAFEQGERSKPIVMGGLLARSDGIPDLDPEVWGDYADSSRRIRLRTRGGNVIEAVDTDLESCVRLSVGGAVVEIIRQGGAVSIRADGPCLIRAAGVTIDATDSSLRATKAVLVEAGETLALRSSGSLAARSGETSGVLDLGQDQDSDGTPHRSKTLRLSAETLRVGAKVPTGGRLPTVEVHVEASSEVVVEAPTITVTGTTKVKIDAPTIEIG